VQSGSTTTASAVDVIIAVDGAFTPAGGYRRVTAPAATTEGYGAWSLALSLTLSAGTHTVDVRVASVAGVTTPMRVSGDVTTVLQGELTAIILKK
jgi:hypothetical protein